MEFLFLIIGLVVGFIIAYFFFKSKKTISIDEANKLNEQINSLNVEAGKLSERIKILEDDKLSLLSEVKSEREKSERLTSENSSLKSDYSNIQTKLTEQKSEIENLQEKFRKEFENLANEIFDKNTSKFSEQSKNNLQEILNPLKEKIFEFQTKVEDTNKESIDRFATLRQQLLTLRDMNQQISQDAQNLTKALKGDTKTQGNWGEFILESLLEKSGLVKDREFSIQESVLSEDGRRLQPDVIVKLPDNKSVIIDSKVSLVAYEKYINTEDDLEKDESLKNHLISVRSHIKNLSSKNYQNIYQLHSIDFVLLFIPIEASFALAMQSDRSLFNSGKEHNIFIVSPTTLLAILRTIEFIWKRENQNKNALEIARQSGALYDKFQSFLKDLTNIGDKLDIAKGSYDEAFKKLKSGRGNLISSTEKIKRLGAKTSKEPSPNILNSADIEDENNLLDE
jgi:DNA recombination protein RmuC